MAKAKNAKTAPKGRMWFVSDFFKKRWVWGVVGFAVVACVGVGIWADNTFNKVQYVTPCALIQEYIGNDISSDFKYVDKKVVATGLVASASDVNVIGLGERFVIELQDESSSDPANRIECVFAKTMSDVPEAGSLEIGQKLSIEGTFVGYGMLPTVGGCSILPTDA